MAKEVTELKEEAQMFKLRSLRSGQSLVLNVCFLIWLLELKFIFFLSHILVIAIVFSLP